jgi:asparagine N-glycosylation enzyme membrane subunit Stt3
MDRRDAIKRAALLVGGSILMPDILKAWNAPHIIENPLFKITVAQEVLIAEIAETIIPTTTTPGAKAAGVPAFIIKMLADCYEQKTSDDVMRSLAAFDANCKTKYGKSFVELTETERIEALKAAEKQAYLDRDKYKKEVQSWGNSTIEGAQPFFFIMKSLTATGYFTSEIGATQTLRYEAVPGRYDGNFPYKKGDKAWAT